MFWPTAKRVFANCRGARAVIIWTAAVIVVAPRRIASLPARSARGEPAKFRPPLPPPPPTSKRFIIIVIITIGFRAIFFTRYTTCDFLFFFPYKRHLPFEIPPRFSCVAYHFSRKNFVSSRHIGVTAVMLFLVFSMTGENRGDSRRFNGFFHFFYRLNMEILQNTEIRYIRGFWIFRRRAKKNNVWRTRTMFINKKPRKPAGTHGN